MRDSLPLTISVPLFGALALGIGRDLSYQEAKPGGRIPVIECGGSGSKKLKRALVRAGLRQLAGDDPTTVDAVMRDFLSKWNALSEKERRRAVRSRFTT